MDHFVPNFIEEEGNKIILTIYYKSIIMNRKVANGVEFTIRKVDQEDGNSSWVYILKINDIKKYVFNPVLDAGEKEKLTTVSDMLFSRKDLAGVNSCFFSAGGMLYSIFKKGWRILSTGPYNRTAIGIRNKNSFYAGTTDFKSSLSFNGKQVTNIDSINRLEKDKITMFTNNRSCNCPWLFP